MSIQENKLKAIADAIREKEGTTALIAANDFPARIRALSAAPAGLRAISLTADPADGGSVAGGGTASDGMTLTVSASPASGFSFNGWKEDGETVSADTGYTFTVSGDKTLTAAFAEESASRLPDGYTEVEYISNPNLGYIADMGIGSVSRIFGNYKVAAKVKSPDSANCVLTDVHYIARNTSGTTLSNVNSYLYVYPDYVKYHTFQVSYTGEAATVIFDPYNLKLSVNGGETVDITLFGKTISGNNKSPLFARNLATRVSQTTYTVNNQSNLTLYFLELYDNEETLKYNYIPAVNSEGVAGLYEMVNGIFYPSSDSEKPFVAGPAV